MIGYRACGNGKRVKNAARTWRRGWMTTPFAAHESATKVGIIGCGVIARTHLAAFSANKQVEVIAVADPDHARAAELIGDRRDIRVLPDGRSAGNS